FYDAYLLAKANIDTSIANSNIPLEFMKEVIKEYGANAHIINSAVNVAADVENESTEFAAKLLNDTLNSKEYRKAFEEAQGKTEENTR
ncbi:MAG: hypothetical protein IKR34_02985, partial [Candidatus Gastranaerophilales bacterium]|nr:hypothetical protein [Candidatus Gastranaerophilales bacterium]